MKINENKTGRKIHFIKFFFTTQVIKLSKPALQDSKDIFVFSAVLHYMIVNLGCLSF